MIVTGREQAEVDVEELSRERVTHRDPVEQGQHAAAPLRRVAIPDRGLTLVEVRLIQRERSEPPDNVGERVGASRRDDGFVRIACERAPIVEGDGDRAGHGDSSVFRIHRTSRRATRPRASPSATP